MNKPKRFILLGMLLWFAIVPLYAQEKLWSLQDCIQYAIEHNLTVKQQEITRDLQQIQLNTSKNSRLPDLNASASQNFGFGRALTSDNTYANNNTQSSSFSLSTSVPLFTGFQIPNTIAVNKLNLQASIADLQKAKEDISVNVASQYVQVLYSKELYKVALEQVKLSEEQLASIQCFYDNGKKSQMELLEAKSNLSQNILSATQAKNDLQLALLDLSQLLELPSPDGFDVLVPTDSIGNELLSLPEDIYMHAVAEKPVILAADYRLQSAKKSINVSQSAYYPSLYLSAGLGSNYYRTSGYDTESFSKQLKNNFNQYIGLSLSIPIFNRFSTRNSVRSARLQYLNSSWQLEESKKTLFKEIQQAYYNAVAAQSKNKSSLDATQSSGAAFRLMAEKYANGKATYTEYNEAQTSYMQAVSNALQAKYEYLFRYKILEFYEGIPLAF